MVQVVRGPGKTTCKKCNAALGPKAVKIIDSGSYHLRCWKPKGRMSVNNFYTQKLDAAGLKSLELACASWNKKIDEREQNKATRNREANEKLTAVDMSNHEAMKVVEGFTGFQTIPTLVLSQIGVYLGGSGLKHWPLVSKHWNTVCKDAEVWKGACSVHPGSAKVKAETNKSWKEIYHCFTNTRTSEPHCAECGKKLEKQHFEPMFSRYLCHHDLCGDKYKTVTCGKLVDYGLTTADVRKYGIRSGTTEIFFEKCVDVVISKQVTCYSLADILRAVVMKKIADGKGEEEEKEEKEEEITKE